MILYTLSTHATALTRLNIAARMGALLTWLMCCGYLLIGHNQALVLFVEELTFHAEKNALLYFSLEAGTFTVPVLLKNFLVSSLFISPFM